MHKNKTWLITGCSTGFGRELAKQVLGQGYEAVVGARRLGDVADIVSAYPEQAIAVQLDVTKKEEIRASVNRAVDIFGTIDVLVNNAGIGYFGAIEESEEEEVRRMFEINFFGLAALTREVLPVMRGNRRGHIINISSIGGFVGFPAVGFYNATKFAVAGYSEALSKEVEPLGIHVTVICPSGFRTDWAGRSANDSKIVIDDYRESAHRNQSTIRDNSGKQPGDPARAAAAIIQVAETEQPPLYLFLGGGAYRGATTKIGWLQKDIETWKEVTLGADAPPES
ncbi:MAG: oxidoreductase [Flavihumibacter sp.]